MYEPRIFITGTDTNVGKTVVATVLALGLDAHYWKPIQAGAVPERDSEFTGRYVGSNRIHPETYFLQNPLSPHLASKNEDIRIDLADIRVQCPIGPLVVEGAGGVMVPLNENEFMLDLIALLQLPVIVVARTELGTINHTLLTIEQLRRKKQKILGIIFSGKENSENSNAIEKYGNIKIIGTVPNLQTFSRNNFVKAFQELDYQGLFS